MPLDEVEADADEVGVAVRLEVLELEGVVDELEEVVCEDVPLAEPVAVVEADELAVRV